VFHIVVSSWRFVKSNEYRIRFSILMVGEEVEQTV